MTTFDFEPVTTAGAPGELPLVGADTLAAARDRSRTWAHWAGPTPAFATDVATELIAQLALAATLAGLPATVLEVWLDEFAEPIEILTGFEQLPAAAWLAVLEQRGEDNLAPIRERARTLAEFAVLDPASTVAPPPSDDPWIYPTLLDWMDGYFFPVVRRSAAAAKQPWCPQWWSHPEAVQRLNALWRAWEALRAGPEPDWSTWWTAHLDPHLAQLTDNERGPFSQCAAGHRDYEADFPHDPPPARWPLPTLEAFQP